MITNGELRLGEVLHLRAYTIAPPLWEIGVKFGYFFDRWSKDMCLGINISLFIIYVHLGIRIAKHSCPNCANH
jgi:hypothetical protein